MTWELSALGIKPAAIVASLAGSVLSLRFIDVQTYWGKASAVAFGFFASVYFSPLAVAALDVKEGGSIDRGIAFAVGLLGLSLTAAVVNNIPQAIETLRKKYIGE